MKQTVNYEGQDYTLATITVGALESIVLDEKQGRQFNIAFVAASLLSSGDTEHGTEEWVRNLPAFGTEDNRYPFKNFLAAALNVNGFKSEVAKGEAEPAAPAEVQPAEAQ